MIPIDYNVFRSFVYSKSRLLARDVEPSIKPKKEKKLGCLCTKEVFPTVSHLDL